MKGSFKKGFRPCDIEEKDEEEPEHISKSLIPVISSDEMDKYATKFLKTFCPDALQNPMPVKLIDSVEEQGLKAYLAPLENDVFGKTYFADDSAQVFLDENYDETKTIVIHPGTVLIDVAPHFKRSNPKAIINNTLTHECVHWYYHRNYFEYRQFLNEELTFVSCNKDCQNYETKDLYWMEWQARTMAPKILMPKKQATFFGKQLLKEMLGDPLNDGLSKCDIYELFIKEFAHFYGVSVVSAKIRLKELGFKPAEGVLNWDCDAKAYAKPFLFKQIVLDKNQTFVLSKPRYLKLFSESKKLRELILSGKMIYSNMMVVSTDPKYYDKENNQMTSYALEHANECCLIFDIHSFSKGSASKIDKYNYLNNSPSSSRPRATIDSAQLALIMENAINNSVDYFEELDNLPKGFGDTLGYHIAQRKITIEKLAAKADVDEKTIRNYKKYNGGLESPLTFCKVMKIALSLKLNGLFIKDLLIKGNIFPTSEDKESFKFINLIIALPSFSDNLEDWYFALKEYDLEGILKLSDRFKRDCEIC